LAPDAVVGAEELCSIHKHFFYDDFYDDFYDESALGLFLDGS
jgi:hypothetical protein